MKICSELPLDILKKDNLRYNDYDFVLFHLFASNPEYHDYFMKMRQDYPERLMIFDNSAYEFYVKGEELDLNKYLDAIVELQPDFYIVPDTLMDFSETIDKYYEFNRLIIERWGWHSPIMGKSLCVAQGNTPEELTRCLCKYYECSETAVAIPFHNSFFKDAMGIEDMAKWFTDYRMKVRDDHRYAAGRWAWFLENRGLLRLFEHVHLLGSHWPKEKMLYKDKVNTFDTAYPIKCAFEGYELENEPTKPNILIDDILTKETDKHTEILIDINMTKFKNY